jgi:hypothetical protein
MRGRAPNHLLALSSPRELGKAEKKGTGPLEKSSPGGKEESMETKSQGETEPAAEFLTSLFVATR